MYLKFILTVVIVCLSARCALSESCQASLSLIERNGNWFEYGAPRRIYDLHITNTHETCAFSNPLKVQINFPPGTSMGYSWGIYGGRVTGFDTLLPLQTHAGVGFVAEGYGSPSATILSYESCECHQEPTLMPQKPSDSDEPTKTSSTSAPTQAPTFAPDSTHYYVGLKFLILTCSSSDVRLNVAKNVLNAVGSQYDLVDYTVWGNAPLTLTNDDGSGKYYAIVSTAELLCWSAQAPQIEAYERQYHVKTVILYSYPHSTSGTTATSAIAIPMNDTTTHLTFAPAIANCSQTLRTDAQIPIKGVYAYLAAIIDTSLATPALYLNSNGTQNIAAAIIHYPDNRTHMEYHADWAMYPVLLGTVWLQWASDGIFAGVRRIEFNAHMDDIFMSTGTFSLTKEGEDTTLLYRLTPEDLTTAVVWQTSLNSKLTSGSNFTLTFPYNGATVKEKGGYGTDPLFLKAKELRDYFLWESHTWGHLYLDNLTYDEVKAEYTKNDETIEALYDVTDTASVPNYCTQSTVTPSITGLFNPNALQAILDHGFRFVVGDNSRANLLPSNAYHSLHTNVTTNGLDGIYVIPRHATNIYYDGSLPEHITTQFNYQYSSKLGNLTFMEIVARDVETATSSLLAFRHDPFMFHQANLRVSNSGYPDGKIHSLLSYWVDQVVISVTKYTALPIKSHKHDHLGQMYLDRENRDACGFSGFLKIANSTQQQAVGMVLRSDGDCVFGVSGVKSSGEHVEFFETYGSEKTTWFSIFPFFSSSLSSLPLFPPHLPPHS